ncbi:host cell division inhibitory peptide Kil [Escherichia coli]|nr:host cell division inhibitory peptide Kil [Escherichia coli]EEV0645969.1 host cell division inhibitory peptide Kil [Escherichia coli]EFA7387911.1 host cell division inhibitory peptide Kil [Escherichia coli]EFD5212406.1 host cell division inhibitory peptide Kil [Escherichia coli]EFG1978452.1 host cell division inhibitory peptide Kil [Escherichia coli]
MRNEIAINHQMLRAAQNKAVIARFIGDSKMWIEANKAMKSAINLPWYRRKLVLQITGQTKNSFVR